MKHICLRSRLHSFLHPIRAPCWMLSSTSPAHPAIPYDTQHTFPSYPSPPELDSGALQQPQAKKRKTERACDACRRKKTRCDGPTAVNNVCTNCIQSKKACTYVYVAFVHLKGMGSSNWSVPRTVRGANPVDRPKREQARSYEIIYSYSTGTSFLDMLQA